MKNLFVVLALGFIVSCEMPEPAPPQYKTVTLVDKKEVLGSHYNLFTKKQVVETEFYLIFSDGTSEQVSIERYVLAKPGTQFKVRTN